MLFTKDKGILLQRIKVYFFQGIKVYFFEGDKGSDFLINSFMGNDLSFFYIIERKKIINSFVDYSTCV